MELVITYSSSNGTRASIAVAAVAALRLADRWISDDNGAPLNIIEEPVHHGVPDVTREMVMFAIREAA